MPSVLDHARTLVTAAALSAALLTGGCGGEKGGNGTDVQMKDLETVDGTINDAMTDLDGAQSEGTAMVQTGNNASATAGAAGKDDRAANASAASDAETEVVADQ